MDKFAPTSQKKSGRMSYREAQAIARICMAKLAEQQISFAHPAIKTSEELGMVMQEARYMTQQMVQQARSQYHMETGKELAWP